MSMLDIVKHAVKAVMFTLNDRDRLSVVTFAGKAFTTVPLMLMKDATRELAANTVENMPTRGLTDIW